MLIKCRYCAKEFEKPSHRNQHERDAHLQNQMQKTLERNHNKPKEPT